MPPSPCKTRWSNTPCKIGFNNLFYQLLRMVKCQETALSYENERLLLRFFVVALSAGACTKLAVSNKVICWASLVALLSWGLRK